MEEAVRMRGACLARHISGRVGLSGRKDMLQIWGLRDALRVLAENTEAVHVWYGRGHIDKLWGSNAK